MFKLHGGISPIYMGASLALWHDGLMNALIPLLIGCINSSASRSFVCDSSYHVHMLSSLLVTIPSPWICAVVRLMLIPHGGLHVQDVRCRWYAHIAGLPREDGCNHKLPKRGFVSSVCVRHSEDCLSCYRETVCDRTGRAESFVAFLRFTANS